MTLTSCIENPILAGFLNLVYRTPIGDACCGLRAMRRDALPRPRPPLDRDGVRVRGGDPDGAGRLLGIREQPIALHPRGGESKLSPLRDGWQLPPQQSCYSPGFLFLHPRCRDGRLWTCSTIATVLAKLTILGRRFYIHAEIAGSMFVIRVGIEVIIIAA